MDEEDAIAVKIGALDALCTEADVSSAQVAACLETLRRAHSEGVVLAAALQKRDAARAHALRTRLHHAVLAARRRISAAETLALRRELLANPARPPQGTSPDDATSTLGKEISASLRAMARQLTDELGRAETSAATLAASTKRLDAAGRIHAGPIDRLLARSRGLVAHLLHRERRERTFLYAAISFYVLVLAYVLASRLALLRLASVILSTLRTAIAFSLRFITRR